MKIVILVDGGKGIGLGHASRGLGLAHGCRQEGLKPILMGPSDQQLKTFIKQNDPDIPYVDLPSFSVEDILDSLPNDVGFLIVDSYRLSENELKKLHEAGYKIALFEDFGGSSDLVDVVINGAPNAPEIHTTTAETKFWLGAKYQILRPKFLDVQSVPIQSQVQSILITLGGDDLENLLSDILDRLHSIREQFDDSPEFHVVVGPYFVVEDPNPGFEFHSSPNNMCELMQEADLAISAGGQTLYELIRCGVPTLAICMDDDQRGNILSLQEKGCIEWIGNAGDQKLFDRLEENAISLAHNVDRRKKMRNRGQDLIDGHGAVRIARNLKQFPENL